MINPRPISDINPCKPFQGPSPNLCTVRVRSSGETMTIECIPRKIARPRINMPMAAGYFLARGFRLLDLLTRRIATFLRAGDFLRVAGFLRAAAFLRVAGLWGTARFVRAAVLLAAAGRLTAPPGPAPAGWVLGDLALVFVGLAVRRGGAPRSWSRIAGFSSVEMS